VCAAALPPHTPQITIFETSLRYNCGIVAFSVQEVMLFVNKRSILSDLCQECYSLLRRRSIRTNPESSEIISLRPSGFTTPNRP